MRGTVLEVTSPVMRKILAAVDGSVASLNAARKALELARLSNASVTLLNVVSPPLVYGEAGFGVSSGLDEAQDAAGAELLREVTAALDPVLPVPTTLKLQGIPADAISEAATQGEYDMVVVGNTGRGSVSRLLVGSVADRLVRICKVPLLLVR